MMREYLLCGCSTVMDGQLVLSVETCAWCNDLRLQAVGTALAVKYREGREAEAGRHVSNSERGRMPDPLHLASPGGGHGA